MGREAYMRGQLSEESGPWRTDLELNSLVLLLFTLCSLTVDA